MNIEVLPEHVIDQIKAGEVLERPAALLKELIENSIDAQSTEINIHLVENGLSLLAIEDNGTGIDFSNLPKAFLRHATSKLKRFEDIYNLQSYGFRGEALASLAASARVTCISQPENLSLPGGKLVIHGGREELLTSSQTAQQGTSLYIKDLFYNTPARLKFIKSKTSEKIQLKKILYSFILSHPEIQFSVKWDDKEKDFFKKYSNNDFQKRIENIFPANATVFSAEETYLKYKITIYFTKEASRGNTHKHQYLFVNARYFQDKSLHQTVVRNLESLWGYGESGHYVILIEAPSDTIDVNVHPNKTQIKFMDSDIIYSLLVTALKTAIKPQSSPRAEQTSIVPFEAGHNVSQFSSIQLSSPTFMAENVSSPNENSLALIDQSFSILQVESKHFLVNLKLLTDYIILSLIDNCLSNEDSISPLLVSEPFQMKNTSIDQSFDQLKKLGFEFDRLGPEVIILRTIPKHLPRAILNYSASVLIDYFSVHHSAFNRQSLESFLAKSRDLKIDFSIPLVKALLALTSLENKSFIVQLNKHNLGSFFK